MLKGRRRRILGYCGARLLRARSSFVMGGLIEGQSAEPLLSAATTQFMSFISGEAAPDAVVLVVG